MHVPNGGQRSARAGAYLKAEGAVPGYPDIMVFWWGDEKELHASPGLAIELKVWPNKPSTEQEKVHYLLRKSDWRVTVCYGLGEVEAIAKAYFGK